MTQPEGTTGLSVHRLTAAPVVDILSARGGLSVVGSAAELRARWRRASLEAGWSFPGDWWVPAVEAVAEAVYAGADPSAGCHRLGMARAEAGVPMSEALADIEALASITPARFGPESTGLAALIHAVAVGWAERAEIPSGGTPCEDPLTQLATPEYLATRLGEIYRRAEATASPVPQTHALVVVSLMDSGEERDARSSASGWDAPMQMVLIAESMRAVFSAGETIAAVRGNTAVALVRRDRELARRVSTLREHIERDRLSASGPRRPSVGVWVEGLPSSVRTAVALLKELRR